MSATFARMVHASLWPCESAPSVTHEPSDVTSQYWLPDVTVHQDEGVGSGLEESCLEVVALRSLSRVTTPPVPTEKSVDHRSARRRAGRAGQGAKCGANAIVRVTGWICVNHARCRRQAAGSGLCLTDN